MYKRWICLLLFVGMMFTVSGCRGENKPGTAGQPPETRKVQIYYYDTTEAKLVPEEHEVNAEGISEFRGILDEMIKGPVSQELKRVLPEDLEVRAVEFGNDILVLNFGNAFDENDIMARYALYQTFFGLQEVQTISLLKNDAPIQNAEGETVPEMNRYNFVTSAPPIPTDQAVVTLYFGSSSQNGETLKAESRLVAVKNDETLEKSVLEELIKGPRNTSLYATVPAETKIISVETKEGTCFVNLSQEFVNKHTGGSTGELMTVYSIVDSLTELDGVRKVQFLIEGQKLEVFKGHLIFNEPFEREESYISE